MYENVFLIDICGTMFRSNTTFDFIRYYYGSNWRVKFWGTLLYRMYNRLMFHFFCRDPLRNNLIGMLKGEKEVHLKFMADMFCKNILKKKENLNVIRIIKEKKKEGSVPVIVSATIDVIAQAVASNYNIPFCFFTELEYDKGRTCLGRIKNDLLSNKEKALKKAAINPPYACIITDNYSDSDLINNSLTAYLISKGNKNKWSSFIKKEKLEQCKIVKV